MEDKKESVVFAGKTTELGYVFCSEDNPAKEDFILYFAVLHHSTHTRLWSWHSCRLRFRFVGDKALCCQEETCDRRGVLKCDTCHLSRVDDARFAHILVFIGTSIVSEVTYAL